MSYQWARRAANNFAPPPSQIFGLRPGMIRMGGGHAYPRKFPNIVDEAMAACRAEFDTMQYGPLYGLPEIREAITAYVAADGITTTPDNILITNGAKHGIDLACRVFLETGDGIIVSDPTYMTALSMFRGQELQPVTVPVDALGTDVDALETLLERLQNSGQPIPKLFYDVPDFHNPTGITMPKARRLKLIALAEKYDFLILEDDPYRNIRFSGEAIPPIQHFDKNRRVIGFGTFSKYLAPGLRVGWVNADLPIVQRMAALKTDGGSSPYTQKILAELLRSGRIPAHIEDLTTELKNHRDAMVEAVDRFLPNASYTVPQGGYYLWIDLNEDIDTLLVAAEAERLDISIIPGAHCYADQRRTSEIRLSFSYNEPDEIVEGIKRLATAVDRVRKNYNIEVDTDMRQFN